MQDCDTHVRGSRLQISPSSRECHGEVMTQTHPGTYKSILRRHGQVVEQDLPLSMQPISIAWRTVVAHSKLNLHNCKLGMEHMRQPTVSVCPPSTCISSAPSCSCQKAPCRPSLPPASSGWIWWRGMPGDTQTAGARQGRSARCNRDVQAKATCTPPATPCGTPRSPCPASVPVNQRFQQGRCKRVLTIRCPDGTSGKPS